MVGVYSQRQYEERCSLAATGSYFVTLKNGQNKELCVIGIWETKNNGQQPLTECMPDSSLAAFKENYPDAIAFEELGECIDIYRLSQISDFKTHAQLQQFALSLKNLHEPK